MTMDYIELPLCKFPLQCPVCREIIGAYPAGEGKQKTVSNNAVTAGIVVVMSAVTLQSAADYCYLIACITKRVAQVVKQLAGLSRCLEDSA